MILRFTFMITTLKISMELKLKYPINPFDRMVKFVIKKLVKTRKITEIIVVKICLIKIERLKYEEV